MQTLRIFFRISRLFAKVLFGLLIVIIIGLAVLHLPPVQKQITHRISEYLSTKLNARVDIQRIRFSVLGNASVQDLTVWDPHKNKILTIHEIEVSSNLAALISGHLVFDEVRIAGMNGKISQEEDELNIQFILDAFKPSEEQDTAQSNPVHILLNKILLENILFEYNSSVNGVSVATNLRMFHSQQLEVTTQPLAFKADQVLLEGAVVNVLNSYAQDTLHTTHTSTDRNYLLPDFGTGIALEIKKLVLKDDAFSYHAHEVFETKKFDPEHLSLKNIQLSLSDILINQDTLAARLESLSAQLPGFILNEARMELQSNREQIATTGLHFVSGSNRLDAELIAPLNFNLLKSENHSPALVKINGQVKPEDLAYFLSDSLMNQFKSWAVTEFVLNGNYIQGTGKIDELRLQTGNSQIQATGIIHDILEPRNISWQELNMSASMGSDFQELLTPYLRNINIPPHVTLQLTSTGNTSKAKVDATVVTSWGKLRAHGLATQHTDNIKIEMDLTGDKVDIGKWVGQSWIGITNLSAEATGMIGTQQDLHVRGLIIDTHIQEQLIHNLTFDSQLKNDSAWVHALIEDADYKSTINSEISFAGPLTFTSAIQFDNFKLGRLLQGDSTLAISGDTKSKIMIEPGIIKGDVGGRHMQFHKQSYEYVIDTMTFHALLSPTQSEIDYHTDFANATLRSNFDITTISELIQTWKDRVLKGSEIIVAEPKNRIANFNIDLDNASFIKLLGVEVEEFAALRVVGEFDEQKRTANLQASSGKFEGYGITLDTLQGALTVFEDSLVVNMNAQNLLYDSIHLGNLDFDVETKGDTAISNLLLTNDTLTLLGLRAVFYPPTVVHLFILTNCRPLIKITPCTLKSPCTSEATRSHSIILRLPMTTCKLAWTVI
jgi:hypothetical protein